ncbi:hypothetical protein AYJ57_00855 [Salipiger sp. CCB-MM3]|uniref:hypothetical protein n=1 Tax=Roseobacteraceae TaxID=2854170 RepID=UPI00080AAB15|nr:MULTISPECIES: hypothetical protein [Roseobacteraceae]ANT59033.1 hypothetical protein AYJ57_00855 [Salipiger sp. CCB-MM3]MCA0994759.1 hypothetical protein [Alloyangia pacifica]
MTSLDLAYSYTARPAPHGGVTAGLAALALLLLIGLPALLAPAPEPGAAQQLDWHGNAAALVP